MYDFVDTIENTQVALFSTERFTLDSEYPETHVPGYQTLTVSGRESLAYEVEDDDMPSGTDGMRYRSKRQQGRIITITFKLTAVTATDFMTRYRALKKFCSGGMKKIHFDDEPYAHYLGTLQSIEEPERGMLTVVGEMSFYCADPYLYADNPTITTASIDPTTGVLTATVDNDSSGHVYPTYRIKHNQENGYLGILHAGGSFEMGSIDEPDEADLAVSKSRVLVSSYINFNNWVNGTTFYQNPSKADVTDMTIHQKYGLGNMPGNFTNTKNSNFFGSIREVILSEDNIDSWRLHVEVRLEANAVAQTGHFAICVIDENNKVLGGVTIDKSSTTSYTAQINFFEATYDDQGNPTGSTQNIYSEKFSAANTSKDNPFATEAMLRTETHVQITKVGRQVTFSLPWIGTGQGWIGAPPKTKSKAKRIQFFVGQYKGKAANQLLPLHHIQALTFEQLNVEDWKDIPNRYIQNSEIIVNCETNSITLSGLPANNEMVDGSNFYPLPVGESRIEFYPSSWAKTPPTVTVEFTKRWL